MSKQTMIPYYFPEEILVDIFHKLPVKSLGRCMCVCKAWNFLIKSPSFVSSHVSKNSTTDTKPFLLVTDFPETKTTAQCSLHVDDHEFSKYALLPHTPFDVPHCMVGSCNGLLCLVRMVYHFGFEIHFILWNPIIRKCFRVPEPCFCSLPYKISIGFGFDSIGDDNDYKILKITKNDVLCKYLEVELYSLRTNSWKILAPPEYDIFSDANFMAFANGVVHWVAVDRVNNQGHSRCKFLLLGFDMDLEVFKEIMLPECLSNLRDPQGLASMFVMPYGELSSIAVIVSVYDECNIWVMEKYNMEETWTKMFNLGILGIGPVPRVLGFRQNGGLILSCVLNRQVVLHDMQGNEGNYLEILGINSHVFSYTESLVLLDQVVDS